RRGQWALSGVGSQVRVRFGPAIGRADLRAMATPQRMFGRAGDTDTARLQACALFPGTPVAVVHANAGGDWLFVLSPRYAAWIEAGAVATGSREEVFGYTAASPHRIITGSVEHTGYTPAERTGSGLQLHM